MIVVWYCDAGSEEISQTFTCISGGANLVAVRIIKVVLIFAGRAAMRNTSLDHTLVTVRLASARSLGYVGHSPVAEL